MLTVCWTSRIICQLSTSSQLHVTQPTLCPYNDTNYVLDNHLFHSAITKILYGTYAFWPNHHNHPTLLDDCTFYNNQCWLANNYNSNQLRLLTTHVSHCGLWLSLITTMKLVIRITHVSCNSLTRSQSNLTKGCITVHTNYADVDSKNVYFNGVKFTQLAHQ